MKWFQNYLLFKIALIALGVGVAACVLLVVWLSKDIPSFEQLENFSPELATHVYSADGKLVKELFTERRFYTPLSEIPEHMLDAVLAIEDYGFYDHWGVDPERLMFVTFRYMTSGSKQQGASTLTQQLARRLYLTPKKTVTRKLKEILTSIQLERTYTKTEILEMYMNQMQFGYSTYGVESAARYFFKKSVHDLTLEQSALLAGMLQRPGALNPYTNYDGALDRRNLVLDRMLEEGEITQQQYDDAIQTELNVAAKSDTLNPDRAPYFVEHVRRKLYDEYGYDIYRTGLKVQTTLDTRLQACANRAIAEQLPKLQERVERDMRQRKNFKELVPPSILQSRTLEQLMADTAFVDSLIDEKCRVQVAFVALEPSTGHVLAMVGGRDFEESEYNRVTQARRQPGSVFKPIVYTAAIDNGYMPYYQKLNQPVVAEMPDGSRWTPANYDLSVGNETTLREGLRRSLNLISVRLVQEDIPPHTVIEYARNMGITTPLQQVDAIALGAIGVIPIEIITAFGVFPNMGVRVEPNAMTEIYDKYDNLLQTISPQSRGVLRPETAYIMSDMLQTVASRGTGAMSRSVYNFYRPAGGKTGTTNDFTDAWYVTFTPQIVAGTWVGLDDPALSLGNRQSGAVAALPITASFMKAAHDTLDLPVEWLERPDGVVDVSICLETQKIATPYCPNVADEICDVRYLPQDTCQVHTGEQKSMQNNRSKRRIRY
ncbi:MAG: PBP1A family penicillin-binding protein [candidate division KSB1 bacterium]|nr:PBP1A family penicillin-binding protein [candidate division KSB1 bacterium]